MLPLATDSDGSTIYNQIGYKEGVRWSSSGQAESSATGIYLSGYIPVSSGDIIYLRNIDMDKNTTVNNECTVWFCTELGRTAANHSVTNLNTYNSPVWDDNGMLIQFAIKGDYNFIRLQSAYLGTDSIVTVNQPID